MAWGSGLEIWLGGRRWWALVEERVEVRTARLAFV